LFSKDIAHLILVEQLHERIYNAASIPDVGKIVYQVGKECNLDLDKKPTKDELDSFKKTFKTDLFQKLDLSEKDNRNDIFGYYVEDLFSYLDDGEKTNLFSVLYKWGNLYSEIADIWIPILYDFSKVIINFATRAVANTICFLARDAIPFWIVTKSILESQGNRSLSTRLVALTRSMKEGLEHIDRKKKEEIIQKLGLPAERFVIIDAGFYGTIVKFLWDTYFADNESETYLFSSRNPNIWGNVNAFFQIKNRYSVLMPYHFAVTLGDSIEAFPKPYKNPIIVQKDDIFGIYAELSDPLSLMGAYSLYNILKRGKTLSDQEKNTEVTLKNMHDLYEEKKAGKRIIPFMLPERLPTWPNAKEFLCEWDCGPTPPMDIFCGHKIP
jgi:hypothetical protein